MKSRPGRDTTSATSKSTALPSRESLGLNPKSHPTSGRRGWWDDGTLEGDVSRSENGAEAHSGLAFWYEFQGRAFLTISAFGLSRACTSRHGETARPNALDVSCARHTALTADPRFCRRTHRRTEAPGFISTARRHALESAPVTVSVSTLVVASPRVCADHRRDDNPAGPFNAVDGMPKT